MTRKEEIEQAAQIYIHTEDYTDLHIRTDAFKAGAKYADSHPQSPWHSVADGDLPKESGDYLCCAASDYVIGSFDKGGDHFYDPFSRLDDERLDWVKYWMEIPQLPK